MSTKVIKHTYQFKRGDEQAVYNENPLLRRGEPIVVYHTDGGISLKIGDGVTRYRDLPAFVSGNIDDALIEEFQKQIDDILERLDGIDAPEGFTDTYLQDVTYNKNTNKLVFTLTNNTQLTVDMPTTSSTVANTTTENVKIPTDKDIKVELGNNEALGGYKTGDVIEAGTSVQEVITRLLSKQVLPTYTKPSISLTNEGGLTSGFHEIGTPVTIKLKATFTKNDAGNLTNITIRTDVAEYTTGTSSPLVYDGSDDGFILSDSIAFFATASYAEGTIKNDNLGSPCTEGHIVAGSVTSNNYALVPYRQGYFWGVLESSGDTPLTSSIIRSGTMRNGAYNSETIGTTDNPKIKASLVPFPKRIFIACPATNTGVTKVIMPSAQNYDCTKDFIKQTTTINIEGANGYEGIPYNVWVYEPASITSDQTFVVTLG